MSTATIKFTAPKFHKGVLKQKGDTLTTDDATAAAYVQDGVAKFEVRDPGPDMDEFDVKGKRNLLTGVIGIPLADGDYFPLGALYPKANASGVLPAQPSLAQAMSYLYSDVPLQVGCTAAPIYITYIDAVDGNDAWDGSVPVWTSGTTGPKKTAVLANWTGSKTSWFTDEILMFRAGTNQNGRHLIERTIDGETYSLPCGQEHTLTAALLLTTRKHIGAYWAAGDDVTKRPVIRSTVNNGATGAGTRAVIYASGTLSQISVSDLIIDPQDVPNRNGLWFYQTADGQTINNITISNVAIVGGTISDNFAYTGIGAAYWGSYARLTAFPVSKQILIANCQAVSYAGHGFGMFGTIGEQLANGKWHGVDYVGCLSVGCGTGMDCHAFTSYSAGVLLDWSSAGGWVNSSGQIYWSDIDARYGRDIPDIDVVYVQLGSGGEVIQLVKNTATPTTPANGEYGFDVGTSGNQRLYVNINTAVGATHFFSTCVRATRGIRYIRCVAESTVNAGITLPKREGHGFAFDDFTSDSYVIESHSVGNDGAGITLNRGNRIEVICCDARENDLGPAKSNFGWGHLIARSKLVGAGYSDTYPGYKGFIHIASATNRTLAYTSPATVIANCELTYTGTDADVVALLGAFGTSPLVLVRGTTVSTGVGKLSAGRVIAQGLGAAMPMPSGVRALGIN